jgi:hypothetical protein
VFKTTEYPFCRRDFFGHADKIQNPFNGTAGFGAAQIFGITFAETPSNMASPILNPMPN